MQKATQVFLLLILTTIQIWAQNAIPTVYNKNVDLYDSVQDNGIKIIDLKGRLFIFGNIFESGNSSLGITTSILDTSGNLLFKKKFVQNQYDEFSVRAATLGNDNNLYAIGTAIKLTDSINGFDLVFYKFKPNGDTVFSRIYHDTGSVLPREIIPFYHNTFLVLGDWTHNRNNAEFRRTNLMIIDTIGNILKSTYTASGLFYPYYLVHDSTKKEVYVLGMKKSSPGSNYAMGSYLTSFSDSTLSTKLTRTNLSGYSNDYLYGVSFYHGSLYMTFAGDPGLTRMCKVKVDGQIISSKWKTYGPKALDGEDICTWKPIFDRENVIFMGWGQVTDFVLHFCDTTTLNEKCNAKVIPPDTNSIIWMIPDPIMINNTHIAITGYCYTFINNGPSTGPGHWTYQTKNYREFLNKGCGDRIEDIKEVQIVAGKFFLFPNPVSDFFTLRNIDLESMKYKVEVLNGLGQVVFYSIESFEKDLRIATDNFPAGIYFCVISNQLGDNATMKFIKN